MSTSRERKIEAELLRVQIIPRAGYDPSDLANRFRAIEEEGSTQWPGSLLNPGNRHHRINEEIARLSINPTGATSDYIEFNRAQRRMSPEPVMEGTARNPGRNPKGRSRIGDSPLDHNVEFPSSRYRTFNGGDIFRVSVPRNWRDFRDRHSIIFAPRAVHESHSGQPVFTHGAIIGAIDTRTGNLQQASDRYIGPLLKNNPHLEARGGFRRASIAGRDALSVTLVGSSPATGRSEVVAVSTAMLDNGLLFYVISVAPNDEYHVYERVFERILRSVEIDSL
jgi:hypothetical protein